MKKTYTGNEGIRDVNNELIYSITVRNQIRQQQVTVGNTATLIPSTPLTNRAFILIQNEGTNPIYIGASTVAVSGADKGFSIYPRGALRIDIEDDVDIYGIAASNTDIVILEGE